MGPTETKIQNIDYSDLPEGGMGSFISRKFLKYAAYIIVTILVVFALSIYVPLLASVVGFIMALLFPLLSFGMFGYFIYAIYKSAGRMNALSKFALKNNFNYIPYIVPNSDDLGTIFGYGSEKNIGQYISGKLGDYSFHDGKYTYKENIGEKDEVMRTIDFTSIDLPRKLPQMIINSKKQSAISNHMFSNSQKMELEGNFNDYFNVFVPDNLQVTILSFLTPDVMEFLVDNMPECDIEIIDSKIYVYWKTAWPNRELYRHRFQLVAKLLDEIGRKLSDGDIFTENYTGSKANSTGLEKPVRLKKSYTRTIIMAVIFAVAILLGLLPR